RPAPARGGLGGKGLPADRGKPIPIPGPRFREGKLFPLEGKEKNPAASATPGVAMNPRHLLLPLALLVALPSFAGTRGFEVRDMVKLDRYSSPTLSPDGRQLVFAKRVLDDKTGKASTALWIEDLFARDVAPPKRLTPEGWNVNSPAFSPDGATVYFLSAKDDSSQLYSMPAAGGEPVKLTAFPVDVDGFKLSPDGSRVAFSAGAFPECKAGAGQGVLACTKAKLDEAEKDKATGTVYDRMFIRHWDTWSDGRINRVFVADVPAAGAAAVSGATLVGADVGGDVPSKPFGDSGEYAWAPDGKSLVLSARKSDRTEPWSTNFDLYQVSADGSGAAKNLTEANKAWDTGPVFGHDGKTLYYRAMKRPGFEADRFAIMAMDLASGDAREIAPGWDRSADGIVVSDDGRTIYTTAQDTGEHPLFALDVASGQATRLVGDGTVSSFEIAGPTLAFSRNTMKTGDQLFTTGLDAAQLRAITPSAGE